MEITLAMFVLVFGLLGILAVFPVGLDSSRKSIENTTAALIGKSVLEYLRVDGTLAKVAAPTPWPDFEQPALFAGSAAETGILTMKAGSSVILTCKRPDGLPLSWPEVDDPDQPPPDTLPRWQNHILMLTTGSLKGKVYQISTNNEAGELTLTQPVLDGDYTGDPSLDLIEQDTHFVILGKVTNTIPQNFFNVTPRLRLIQYERLDKSVPSNANTDYAVPADISSDSDYSYVCILSGHLPGSPNTAQATILVYKNYVDFHNSDTPEYNQPPISYFTTILAR
ncbi:MAG: hypothetical protein QGG54_09605 [Gammaproteobacteria bacterium]|nr:hypothetical protein [Gammaproteobacteria bacterium]